MEADGARLFRGCSCNQWHDGPLFSDHLVHTIGVRPVAEDLGRAAITNNADNNAQFKTPVLRNVELHAPYFHNGKFATLEDVVAFYNRGGDFDAPNIDRGVIRPMGMTQMERQHIAAFMRRPMTDPRVQNELPPFDRPQLYTESSRVPTVSGTGRAGTGGVVPNPIALEPPLVGNPSFTVAVVGGAAGANAVVVISQTDPGIGTTIPAAGSLVRGTTTLSAGGRGSYNFAIPDTAAIVGTTFYGRWYIPDAAAANGFSVSRLFSFTVFGESSVPSGAAFVDFDGDRKTDVSIFRPSAGEWWYLRSSDGGNRAFQFGAGTDEIVPADYTGDGKTDIAIWRDGQWFVMRSEDFSFYSYPFGAAGDIPLAGDFDADGQADSAIFRSSATTWYIRKSSGGVDIKGFGAAGDIPQVGDYDGDGKADAAVYRNGVWYVLNSGNGSARIEQFGVTGDIPSPAAFLQ
jgi:hypothetical protein